jgi:uncharacterized membrane protein YbhN (UPF0104 family)
MAVANIDEVHADSASGRTLTLLEQWRRIAALTAGSGGRWHWLGYAVSIALLSVAAVTLFRILSKIDPDRVWAALHSVSAGQIALATVLMAGSYLSLTFYDFFALRTIGHTQVPYRTAATAGFSSYAIGHNLGATAITCGIVRYHVYSASGLGLIEVAKICFLTGLTFWLGNAWVLGASLSLAPEAAQPITRLPVAYNQAAGLALLFGSIVYILWVTRRRTLGRNNWRVALPGWRSTIVQIGIGVLDLSCCVLAMYVLLPPEPSIAIASLAAVFVSALLLGYASHAPGGLGVFDAAMLIGLPQFAPEPLLASLLLFRLIGYLLPGFLAVALLAVRQVVMRKPAQV